MLISYSKMILCWKQFIAYFGGFMIPALVLTIASMTSSLDCSYLFHYFCLLMSK